MFVHMSNHLVSLSLHKFTRLLLDYTILTFCHFLPWFSTMYLLELPLHDSMSAEVTGATGGEAATMGHVGHKSIHRNPMCPGVQFNI